MKNQRIWRAVLYAGFLLLCCCLSGCSASFFGLNTGKQEELVFSCAEDVPKQQTEASEEEPSSAGRTDSGEADAESGSGPVIEESSSGQKDQDKKVDLNTAGLEELMTLNGVGESRAKAIMEYRAEKGPFTKIEDIMQISGIKEGIFSKIKDQITVH